MKATCAAVWNFACFVLINAQASLPISNIAVTQSSPGLPIAALTAVNLTCEVSGLGSADSRLWMMDGQPLSTDNRITLSVDNSTVSFNPVLLSDTGAYQCTASNLVSSKTSDAYGLIINYGPEQVSITGPDSAVLNSSVTFVCSARSTPACFYTWYFNGKEKARGSEYKIDAVNSSNTGSYSCLAANPVTGGTSIAEKRLDVTGVGEPPAPSSLTSQQVLVIVTSIAAVLIVSGLTLSYFGIQRYKKKQSSNQNNSQLDPGQKSSNAAANDGPSLYEHITPTGQRETGKIRKQRNVQPEGFYTDLELSDESLYTNLKR
ncbi:carcinoembryonic antigen-related cell adhesion molecule 5-like [Polyodon spathula]|uniref:carcinoembryonic antigen-related cell adhesion molecule 5-like n=1 Tax=Polyodon spathula TaxID=7913 RepID=UPI001B7DCD16|nr:carcinoembryonic antigen-related cell adhesion molecule 5-like [Polyodon spathula]